MTSSTFDQPDLILDRHEWNYAVLTSSLAAAGTTSTTGGIDPMTIILFAIFAVVIFMMFRRQKKAKAAQQEKQSKLAPGVNVMTNFGLFGKVLDIDEAENKIVLELSPGNTATVHRQTVAKIEAPEDVSSIVPDDASSLTIGQEPTAPLSNETAQETLDRLNLNSESSNDK